MTNKGTHCCPQHTAWVVSPGKDGSTAALMISFSMWCAFICLPTRRPQDILCSLWNSQHIPCYENTCWPQHLPSGPNIPKVSRAFKRMNTLKAPGPESDSDPYMLQADQYHLRFLPLSGMCTQLSLVFPVLPMTALLNTAPIPSSNLLMTQPT